MVELKRSIQRGFIATCLFFVLVLLIPAAAHARTYQNIAAFGDSLSGHFGLAFYLGPYDSISNPNGAPAVWSNGDVWIEYLAGEWEASLDNNAIGGAMTKGHESEAVQALSDSGKLSQQGFGGQTDLYLSNSPGIDQEKTLFTILALKVTELGL